MVLTDPPFGYTQYSSRSPSEGMVTEYVCDVVPVKLTEKPVPGFPDAADVIAENPGQSVVLETVAALATGTKESDERKSRANSGIRIPIFFVIESI